MADLLNTMAPEFDADPLREDYLVIAASLLNPTCFAAQMGLATSLLAAHMLTMLRRDVPVAGTTATSTAGGALSTVREGDIQVGYRAPIELYATAGDAWLGESKYGRQFLYIRGGRACGHARVVVPG